MSEKKENFEFNAKTPDGKLVAGTVVASNQNEAINKIVQNNLSPIKVSLKSDKSTTARKKIKAGSKTIMYFFKKMGTLIKSGVHLLTALEIIESNAQAHGLQRVIHELKLSVNEGDSLKKAMSNHPQVFDKFMINIVGVGEETGSLEKSFFSIFENLQKKSKLKQVVKSALSYPVILISVSALVTWALLVFVVPEFQKLFSNAGKELPLITQMVIKVSQTISEFWPLMITSIVGVYIFARIAAVTDTGKKVVDRFMLKLPYVGKLVLYNESIKFCDTFSSLVAAGILVDRSIDLCSEVVSNGVLVQALRNVHDDVSRGLDLTLAFKKTGVFPSIMEEMGTIGESTGDLAMAFTEAGIYMEEELSESILMFTKLLEPIALLSVSAIVVTVLIAMYLPIFSLADVL